MEVASYQTISRGQKKVVRPEISTLLYGKQAAKPSRMPKFEAPTAEELQELQEDAVQQAEAEEEVPIDPDSLRRFGKWDGVFARSLLNIFGVIMFIRLGFIFGVAGIGFGSLVIFISVIITMTTTLSLSAICTNGDVAGGGAYYMISRALGPQFGGIIGVLFSLANAVAIAIYVIGFAESILDQAEVLDVRSWGCIVLSFVTVLCFIGVDWVIKVQLVLLAFLVVCIIAVIVGTLLKPQPAVGFVGISTAQFKANWGPRWEEDEGNTFVSVLGLFFPAVTGIMAGANMSGEIKNPGNSIPYGTIYAVVVSGLVYWLMGVLLASSCAYEVFTVGQNVDGTPILTTNRSEAIALGVDPATEGQGLRWNFFIMADLSFWGPLIFIGIYAATLSSAIASLVGAPRILMSVARDDIIPALSFFKVGHGKKDEPWRGYTLSALIALIFVLIADLDFVAPLITGFFMISYFFVNFACFAGSFTKTPGWRPGFRYYNKWASLLGGIGCLVIMFLLSWVFAFITLGLSVAIYLYLVWADPDVSWGSAPEALRYSVAFGAMRRLDTTKAHVKNYRPQYLIMSGNPRQRLALVTFANQLRKGNGLMMYGNVILHQGKLTLRDETTQAAIEELKRTRTESPLKKLHIKGFMETVIDSSLASGARSLMQLCGVSKMKPNIVLLGFKKDWALSSEDELNDYLDVIRYAFVLQNGGKWLPCGCRAGVVWAPCTANGCSPFLPSDAWQ